MKLRTIRLWILYAMIACLLLGAGFVAATAIEVNMNSGMHGRVTALFPQTDSADRSECAIRVDSLPPGLSLHVPCEVRARLHVGDPIVFSMDSSEIAYAVAPSSDGRATGWKWNWFEEMIPKLLVLFTVVLVWSVLELRTRRRAAAER